MTDEDLKQYVNSGGPFFSIRSIDTYRDGGTILIETTKGSFFISTKNEISKTYRQSDPLTELETKYLISRINQFQENTKYKITLNNNVLNLLSDTIKTHENI